MDLVHTKSVEQVFQHFSVEESTGLSLDEVQLSQEKYGPNGTYVSLTNVCLILQLKLCHLWWKTTAKMNENDYIFHALPSEITKLLFHVLIIFRTRRLYLLSILRDSKCLSIVNIFSFFYTPCIQKCRQRKVRVS